MLKFLKKEKKMENYDQATLVERLVSEQEDINQVDLSKKHVRAAMFEAIGKRPHLVAKINGENAKELLSESETKEIEQIANDSKDGFLGKIKEKLLQFFAFQLIDVRE